MCTREVGSQSSYECDKCEVNTMGNEVVAACLTTFQCAERIIAKKKKTSDEKCSFDCFDLQIKVLYL